MHTIELYQDERTALFIDSFRTTAAAYGNGISINYAKILDHFCAQSRLVHAFYYEPEPYDLKGAQALAASTPAKSGPSLARVIRPDEITSIHTDASRRGYIVRPGLVQSDERSDVNSLMAYDLANCETVVDHIVLFSPRGRLASILRAVRNKGARVTVVGYHVAKETVLPEALVKCLTAQAIRRNCDRFVDLTEIARQYAFEENELRTPMREALP